tara:strand:- start:8313 stop:8552 length:240 start_codon:yes stop_codon:yes gene_type:complete
MTNEKSQDTSGSYSQIEIDNAHIRAYQFGINLLYDMQFQAIPPLIEEIESLDSEDHRVKILSSVLDEALLSFPLLATEV